MFISLFCPPHSLALLDDCPSTLHAVTRICVLLLRHSFVFDLSSERTALVVVTW